MARKTQLIRSASSAIAAVLVLGSTQAMAQAISVPSVPTPPVGQAAPSAPAAADSSAPTMVSEPVIQQVPEAIVPPELPVAQDVASSAVTEAATPVAARTSGTVARNAVPRVAENSAPVVTAPDASISAVQADVTPVSVTAAPPASEISSPVVSNTEDGSVWTENFGLLTTLLAALGIGALAVWGFVTIGRRKARPAAIERPVVAQPAPVEPTMPVPPLAATPITTPRVQSASLSHSGASVPLPRSLPGSFEERDSLLRRMVAAKPDRANPFVSPRARLHRARLILQSLGQDFGGRETWIDLSQYPSNWPSTDRPSAAA